MRHAVVRDEEERNVIGGSRSLPGFCLLFSLPATLWATVFSSSAQAGRLGLHGLY